MSQSKFKLWKYANGSSFATSVASRSLTMRQACVLAAICEFLGAVLVGAKVAGTIKNGAYPVIHP